MNFKQTGRMFDLEFKPESTPSGVPVLTCFRVRGNPYVVDEDGNLYLLNVEGDDPDLWTWCLVQQL